MKYLGLPYDFRNKVGVNCWGLYSLVMRNELNVGIEEHGADECTNESIAAAFVAGMTRGTHNHVQLDNPEDMCLVLLNKKNSYHCGIWFKNKMLHAKGNARTGQVWYDDISKYEDWNVRYFKYDN